MTVPTLITETPDKVYLLQEMFSAFVYALQYVQGQTITTAGAQTVNPKVNNLLLNNTVATIAATIADAKNHAGIFTVKAGTEPAVGQDHTLTLTIGTFDGTNNVATFADANDSLTVVFDIAGNGTVLNNTGTVALS